MEMSNGSLMTSILHRSLGEDSRSHATKRIDAGAAAHGLLLLDVYFIYATEYYLIFFILLIDVLRIILTSKIVLTHYNNILFVQSIYIRNICNIKPKLNYSLSLNE
jgi:hypothetical protein